MSPVAPPLILPTVCEKRSQLDSPFPSTFHAPSTWYAAEAIPQRNSLGKRARSISEGATAPATGSRSEEHTSELQSHLNLVCRLLLAKKHTSELQSHLNLVCRLLLEKKHPTAPHHHAESR